MMNKMMAAGFAIALVACGGSSSSSSDGTVDESGGMLLAGPKLSETEIASLLKGAGFSSSEIPEMVCTAKYESGFYEHASNHNTNGTTDYGVFQINSVWIGPHGCAKTGSALYDGAANAKCAKAVFDAQGIRAWYGYQKHASECSHYKINGSSSSSDSTSESGTGCWSSTLNEEVRSGTCVNSSYQSGEYQCVNGQWLGGVEDGRGPGGDCTSEN